MQMRWPFPPHHRGFLAPPPPVTGCLRPPHLHLLQVAFFQTRWQTGLSNSLPSWRGVRMRVRTLDPATDILEVNPPETDRDHRCPPPPGRPLAIPKEGARLVDKRRRCSLGPHVKVFPGRVCSHANASARTSHPPPKQLTWQPARLRVAVGRLPGALFTLPSALVYRPAATPPPASWLCSGPPVSSALLLPRPPPHVQGEKLRMRR